MGAQRAMANRSIKGNDIVTSLCHYELMSTDSINRLPFYAQAENVIIGFSSNSLPHGADLPSEDNLVQEYAVSRTSLPAAIQSLVHRGLTPLAWKGGAGK